MEVLTGPSYLPPDAVIFEVIGRQLARMMTRGELQQKQPVSNLLLEIQPSLICSIDSSEIHLVSISRGNEYNIFGFGEFNRYSSLLNKRVIIPFFSVHKKILHHL